VIFSSRHNYWHVSKRHSDYLDRLFEVSWFLSFYQMIRGSLFIINRIPKVFISSIVSLEANPYKAMPVWKVIPSTST
jgi:hypothetical protein